VKCPKCVEEGKKSKIQIGATRRTAMGVHKYYDEDGNFHLHDPNTSTTFCTCSNGHNFQIEEKDFCPLCGTGSESLEYSLDGKKMVLFRIRTEVK